MTNNETAIKNILHELGHTSTIDALRHAQQALDILNVIEYELRIYGSLNIEKLKKDVARLLRKGG